MKNKKYVFELIVRETENLEKICSIITACDYSFEELKERKVDNEILFCKDVLVDHLPKKELEKYFKDTPQKTEEETCYGYMRVDDGEIFIKDKKTNNFYNVNMQEFKDKGHLVHEYSEGTMNNLVKKGCFRKIVERF
jgi:hypothetical protein